MRGYPDTLLTRPGLGEYRIVNASGTLHMARGEWGVAPEVAFPESFFSTSAGPVATGIVAADGSTTVLSNCRVLRYDSSFRPVFRTGPLQLTSYQDPGCIALAVAASGTTYVRDSGNGVLVIDAAGVQQDTLPLALPAGTDLDAYAMVAAGDVVVIAGSVGNQVPWIGAANAAGQILWSHVIDTAVSGGWSARLVVEAGQIHALFATSVSGGAHVLLRRFDLDGNEVATGYTDALVPSNPGTRMIVRGGSTAINTSDQRLLLWRTGQSAPTVLAAPDAASIGSFDIAPDGRIFALAAWQLLRFETDGSLGAVVDPQPALFPLQLSVIDSTRIVVSAWLEDGEQVGVAQFDGNLAMQRVHPLVGVPRLALSNFAEGGARRYLVATDFETAASRANSFLIATDAKGRELWRRTGDFTRLAADAEGVWATRDRVAVRFGVNGEELGSQDLSAYVQQSQFPRLYAGQAGEVFLDSDLVPGAPGECRVVVVTVAAAQPLPGQPCGDGRAISLDGELIRSYQGALVRTRRDGTLRYSVPINPGESGLGILADGSVLVGGTTTRRLLSADGELRWSLPSSNAPSEVDALFFGSDVVYRVHGAAPVMVSKHRLSDAVLIGETQLGHVGPEPLNIGAGRVDAEGRLLLVGQRRVDTDNWVLTTHVVEPDLSVRAPQVWARGASAVRGVWSDNAAVYAAIGSPLDYRQARPAIIRAGGEIWVHGFED